MKYSGARFGIMPNAAEPSERQSIAMDRNIRVNAPHEAVELAAHQQLHLIGKQPPESPDIHLESGERLLIQVGPQLRRRVRVRRRAAARAAGNE